jgi:hypothetical protein
VAIKSPEGIVLAADSILTLVGERDAETGEVEVMDLYQHSNKIHQIGNYPIGIITAGAAGSGARSIQSYITEFSNELIQQKDDHGVGEVASLLYERLSSVFGEEEEITEGTDIICAGYSPGENIPDVYRIVIPQREPERYFYGPEGHFYHLVPIGYGEQWIYRWYFGYAQMLPEILGNRNVDEETRAQVIEDLQRERLPIPIQAMPLQEVVDLAVFLINLAIGSSRFCLGASVCGGEIDVAAITRRGSFQPLRMKQLRYKPEYGSFA